MALHPKQFGMVLKNVRMDKKLTQAELAEKLDISLSSSVTSTCQQTL